METGAKRHRESGIEFLRSLASRNRSYEVDTKKIMKFSTEDRDERRRESKSMGHTAGREGGENKSQGGLLEFPTALPRARAISQAPCFLVTAPHHHHHPSSWPKSCQHSVLNLHTLNNSFISGKTGRHLFNQMIKLLKRPYSGTWQNLNYR